MTENPMHINVLAGVLLLGLLMFGASVGAQSPEEPSVDELSRQFVEGVTERAAAADLSRSQRSAIGDWSTWLIEAAESIEETEPRSYLVELLALTKAVEDYLLRRDTRSELEDSYDLIKSRNDSLRASLSEVVSELYPDDSIALMREADQRSETMVVEHLKSGGGGLLSRATGGVLGAPSVPGLPGVSDLNPINSLAESLDNTTIVLDNYPEKVRREAETVLSNPSTLSALESLERFSKSSERFAGVSEALPDEIQAMLEQLANEQPAYQGTIREANTLVATTGATTDSVNTLAATLDQLVNSVTELAAMFPPDPNAPPPPPSRPFDIREYEAAVSELNTSLAETNKILERVDSMIATERVSTLLDETTTQTEAIVDKSVASAEGLISSVLHSLIELVVVIAVMTALVILLYFYVKRNLWTGKKKS